MKRFIPFHLLIFTLFLMTCTAKQPSGEIIAPPEGMEQSVKEFIEREKGRYVGMNVRHFPQDVYFVVVDFDTRPNMIRITNDLIVQKAMRDGGWYWQIRFANNKDRETYKIK